MTTRCQLFLISCLLSVLILHGCDAPKLKPVKLEGIERTIKLDSGLGSFTIVLPEEMDTFFTWVHQSDHEPGDMKNYRYQDSRFPIWKGYVSLWRKPDSISCFTISHVLHLRYSEWSPENERLLPQRLRDHEKYVYGNDNWLLRSDTTIDQLPLYIFGRKDTFPRGITIEQLNVYSVTNKIVVQLSFQRKARSPYPTNFIQDAYERIKQIKYTPEHAQ